MSFPFDLHSAAVSDSHGRAVALRRTAWSEHGMASVNQTRPHCVNQLEKTHSKPLAARHAMCESAFRRAKYGRHAAIQIPSYTVARYLDHRSMKVHRSSLHMCFRWSVPFSVV